MVLLTHQNVTRMLLVGPWLTTTPLTVEAGAEIVWIKFALGTFMPARPTHQFVNTESAFPDATSHSFWLKNKAWQFPDYNNADVFIEQLAKLGILAFDDTIPNELAGRPSQLAPRTVRYRFARATGQSHRHIVQVHRARQAFDMLRHAATIDEVIARLGYYDHPHLTRSLKKYTGTTPAQLRSS